MSPWSRRNCRQPIPKNDEILVKVSVCGLCYTPTSTRSRAGCRALPIAPGHQVVGTVTARSGDGRSQDRNTGGGHPVVFQLRGVPVLSKRPGEPLGDHARWTGKDANGGYAEFMAVPEGYAYPIPGFFRRRRGAVAKRRREPAIERWRTSATARPSVCSGSGASAHIVIQLLRHEFPNSDVFVFTRGDEHKELARTPRRAA